MPVVSNLYLKYDSLNYLLHANIDISSFVTANRLLNIYKASIMRSVTQIKKNTAIKELHVALVPKWTSIPDTDKDDLESGSSEDRLAVGNEVQSIAENTDKANNNKEKQDKSDIHLNGAFENSFSKLDGKGATNSSTAAGKSSSAVASSHVNKGDNTMIDCDRTESEITKGCDKGTSDSVTNSANVIPEVPKIKYFFERGDSLKKEENETEKSEVTRDCCKVTNSGDNEAVVKSSSSHSGADICDNLKASVIPEVPKMKYFFERGDSLKKEENEMENFRGGTEKEAISHSSKGVKRAHDSEVLIFFIFFNF